MHWPKGKKNPNRACLRDIVYSTHGHYDADIALPTSKGTKGTQVLNIDTAIQHNAHEPKTNIPDLVVDGAGVALVRADLFLCEGPARKPHSCSGVVCLKLSRHRTLSRSVQVP